MQKGVVLLPILLLLAPGILLGTGLTVRNFQTYYPLFAVLMLALLVNIVLLVWHHKKEKRPK